MNQLEQYILDHITPEDDLLKELNRQTHVKVLRPRMLSGHLQGQFLYLLCKMINPSRILEIGTYTGYSAICMAKGLADGGHVDTIEVNDELLPFIAGFIQKAGLENIVRLHVGSAVDIVPRLEGLYDLAFIDGDKREYPVYYPLVLDKVRPGGFILADNVLWDGKVIKPLEPNDNYTRGILDFNTMVAEDDRVETVILPIRDGITVIRKK
ncbi:MAG: O-methyltransferase [Breznakibacter sp.]